MTSLGGPLDLSQADTRGFEAVDSGRYNAEVAKIDIDAVKNSTGQGKMPAGTPMIKIQYKLLSDAYGSEDCNNRRVFQSLVIPPKDYDKTKAQKMQGMIVNTLVALGEAEEKVRNPKFNPDFSEYEGRPCVLVVGKEPKKDDRGNVIEGEFNNPVKGVKPAGSIAAGEAAGSAGLL